MPMDDSKRQRATELVSFETFFWRGFQRLRATVEDSREVPRQQSGTERFHRLATAADGMGVGADPVDVRAVTFGSERQRATLMIERRN